MGLSQPALPKTKKTATVLGLIENSCADWITLRGKKDGQYYEFWLMGVLSSLNLSDTVSGYVRQAGMFKLHAGAGVM